MDQTIVNIVGGVITAGFGWFANTVWMRLNEHDKRATDGDKRVNDLAVKLAGEYVSNAELAKAVDDINSSVNRLISSTNENMVYIRNRLDGMPQRRQGDPG